LDRDDIMNHLYVALGFFTASLGIVGVFLPVWPTTPFLLLSVVFFSRSNRRFDDAILNTKRIGPVLRDYLEHRKMTQSAKTWSLLFLWTGLGLSMVWQNNPWIIAVLALVGLLVSIHLWLLPSDTTPMSRLERRMKGRSTMTPIRILFIGNSFTYGNDLPDLLRQMGASQGQPIETGMIAYGGYRLAQYLQEGSTEAAEVENALAKHEWDYVVLQDHSRGPLDDKALFDASVDELDARIRAINAKTVLYATWSYRDHSAKLATTNMTHTAFHHLLQEAYGDAARRTGAWLAPVGDAFDEITHGHPEIDLLLGDDFHASLAGSTLAAAVFYERLIGWIDPSMYHPKDLDERVWRTLVDQAIETVQSMDE
jgi:uncharacterized membrane protein YbaN (DUF454 family)